MNTNLNFKNENVEISSVLTEETLSFYFDWVGNRDLNTAKDHVIEIWNLVKEQFHTYRCIQHMSFLTPRVVRHSCYQSVIDKYHSSREVRVADIGCCFGQDTRKLIFDGIPGDMIYAIDLHDGYWKAGLNLFQDISNNSRLSQELRNVHTIFTDMTIPLLENNLGQDFNGSFDAVILQAVLHVLSQKQSLVIIENIFTMLKSGGVLMGSCAGAIDAQDWALTPDGSSRRFLHSPVSLEELFRAVGFHDITIETTNIHDSVSRISFQPSTGLEEQVSKNIYVIFQAYKP